MKYLGVLVFLFFVVSCNNENDSSFLGNIFGKPDIKYDCDIWISGKQECDFVNNGNKAGRLCIRTVVSQNPKFSTRGDRPVTSFNCSGIINAKDKRTIKFPNNFNGYVGRVGFARDGITDLSYCVFSTRAGVDRRGNKVKTSTRIRELQAIWHYGCEFEYTPYIIEDGKKKYL